MAGSLLLEWPGRKNQTGTPNLQLPGAPAFTVSSWGSIGTQHPKSHIHVSVFPYSPYPFRTFSHPFLFPTLPHKYPSSLAPLKFTLIGNGAAQKEKEALTKG